ncbi:MAG: hypothetical protein AB7G08_33240 [Hyphomicrobiaceae bacterium]
MQALCFERAPRRAQRPKAEPDARRTAEKAMFEGAGIHATEVTA